MQTVRLQFLLVGLLALSACFAHGQSTASLTTGLVGHYLLDGNLDDLTGNGKNPSMVGATFGPDRFGVPGRALAFPAKENFATSGNALLPIGARPRTLSVWIKIEAYEPGAFPTFLSYGLNSSKGDLCAVFVDAESQTLMVDNWGDRVIDPKATPISIGVWSQVVFTFSGTMGRLFQNGRLITSAPIGLNTADNRALRFGAMDSVRFLRGSVDDVRVYDRALSDTEVAALYDLERPAPPNASGPLKARGVATVNSGFLTGITVTESGRGYTNAPNIRILGSGTGAKAIAQVSNGFVANVIILAAGSGYLEPPLIVFDPPIATPTLSISTSAVKVTLAAVAGRKYQFESSPDGQIWRAAGEPFIAETDEVSTTFPVAGASLRFRVKELP